MWNPTTQSWMHPDLISETTKIFMDMHEEWGEKGLLHEQQASDIADIYEAAGIEPIPADYDKPVKFGMGQTSAPIPGEPLAPRSELPPDAPTAFEKGQTYYDFTKYFRPVRWSESKQAWVRAL